jgi:hypothetical protein
MCSLDIALRKYMAGEVIKHRPKVLLHVFDQYNCTKNRGACVDGVIWLTSFNDQPN